jgi:hypothetical protein
MTNPPMLSPRVDSSPGAFRRGRAVRWLLPAALLALTPKCVLCVLAYVGAGAALGIGGPEWCGLDGSAPVSWDMALAWLGCAGVLVALVIWARVQRVRGGD